MKRIAALMISTCAACSASPDTGEGEAQGYVSVDLTSATIRLAGDHVDEIVILADMTGPHVDGAPLSVAFSELVDANYNELAALQLTTGDQTWTGAAITLADDGTPVAPLQALCGRTANVYLTLGGDVTDDSWDPTKDAPASHFEGETTEIDNIPIDCS